ncbi:hypothetical protein NLI96_g6183 [Meripilus lineatus]|uniref:KN homeodomain domain-containing protein n=1 Tax=Meripilus lineatus TaxID=2056292 RepID=A0AAD5YG72_9APHY|nr:hypothetical protein NLI96_g6183 [Physisporinus lineatus]
MSSSAASDSSSLQSRPEKRASSPTDSPIPKKLRQASALDPVSNSSWSNNNTPSPQPVTEYDDRSELSSPRVQLPSIASTFQDRHEIRRASLPTLYSESSANRLRLPQPAHRQTHSTSGLSSYQFPNAEHPDDRLLNRPRLDTQVGGVYGPGDYSLPSTALSSTSSFPFSGNSPLSSDFKSPSSGLSTDDHWSGSGIVRPNSTPGTIPGALSPSSALKYDDSLRHSSLSGSNSQQLFGGVTRIAGHSSDRSNSVRNGLVSSIKTEADWTFPNTDFSMNSASAPSSAMSATSAPSISVNTSPTRSPQAPTSASSLVERPPRKRGKLPKPVTDFLKDWLHRHSDHPYPSEEEKKQLCHATGLSMSQKPY